jgi:hypothetical protein
MPAHGDGSIAPGAAIEGSGGTAGGFVPPRLWGIAAVLVPLFTLVSIFGVNGYHYGVWDHAVVVPFVKASLSPGLYPGDLLLSAERYYYTFLWKGLAAVAKAGGLPLPPLFFVCYCAALSTMFLAFFSLAIVLFRRWEIGLLACSLLVFSRVTLADTATVESILLTRTAALPLLLFSLCAFLRGRHARASVLLGLAFLIHPMSASYVAFMLLCAALADLRRVGVRRLIACSSLFIAVSSPLLIWKVLATPGGFRLFSADPEWMQLLALRSPHHIFPFSWAPREFVGAALALAAFVAAVGSARRSSARRSVAVFALAVLLLCAAGVVFSQWLPVPAVFTLQPLRSFQFIVYFAILYLAALLFDAFGGKRAPSGSLLAALVSCALLYDSNGWKGASAASVAFILLFAVIRAARGRAFPPRAVSCAYAGLILVAGSLASPARGEFEIGTAQNERWLDIQRWARSNTPVDGAFIVPPRIEGFRVESERAIYADWKDGTLMNFDPAFGREWYRRMERLGASSRDRLEEGFARLAESDFIAIARDDLSGYARVFLVVPCSRGSFGFPLVYGNAGYAVYEVSERPPD